MSLPTEASASGERSLVEAPNPGGPWDGIAEGGGKWLWGKGCGEEGLTWTKTEVRSQTETSRIFCFLLSLSRFQRPVVGTPGSPQHGNSRVRPEPTSASPGPCPVSAAPHTSSLCDRALGPATADRAPTGAALTATIAFLGPQWQGCPGASSCQQSRWVPLPSLGL